MTISVKDTFRRNSDIVASEIDNETVMMDKDFQKYFGLQEIGTRAWQMLEDPTSIEQMAERLVKHYDVSMEQCMEDLIPLMTDLLKNEMIVRV